MVGSKRILGLLVLLLWASGYAAASPCVGTSSGAPCEQVGRWDIVGIEHEDRMNRLLKIGDGIEFTFSETFIPPEVHRIPGIDVSIPVLRVVARQDVFFDTARDEVRPEALPLLDVISENLKKEPPDIALFIAGHTDARGTDDDNYELGLRRAHSVAEALLRRGLWRADVYEVSFGEAVPLTENTTQRGMQTNRRVEFLFASHVGAIVAYLEQQEVPFCTPQQRDAGGRCRIKVPAVQVIVDPSYKRELSDLAEQQSRLQEMPETETLTPDNDVQLITPSTGQQQIGTDSSTQSVSVLEERQEIEVKRLRIPVIVTNEKIFVDVGRQ